MRTHTQETLQSAAPQEYSHIYKCGQEHLRQAADAVQQRDAALCSFAGVGLLTRNKKILGHYNYS